MDMENEIQDNRDVVDMGIDLAAAGGARGTGA
jgi:hypothetical protein